MKTVTNSVFRTWYSRVYILPLRNENLLMIAATMYIAPSLYPTFKEWKQWTHQRRHASFSMCLYPTFKEWKRFFQDPGIMCSQQAFISYL